MRSAQENRIIGRIIVGAMCIDGTLSKKERDHVAHILNKSGAPELVADVGLALENDMGDFDLFKECRDLLECLGSKAKAQAPEIFDLVARIVASDRYVSAEEASYLSAFSRRIKLSTEQSKRILKKIIEEKRGRLEISGEQVDAMIHPHLKELLSFCGAEEVVGELSANSIQERMYDASDLFDETLTMDDVEKALVSLGLSSGGTLEEAEEVWKETMESINLGSLAYQGEAFVGAALERAQKVQNAYSTLVQFDKMLSHKKKQKKNEASTMNESGN